MALKYREGDKVKIINCGHQRRRKNRDIARLNRDVSVGDTAIIVELEPVNGSFDYRIKVLLKGITILQVCKEGNIEGIFIPLNKERKNELNNLINNLKNDLCN